MDKVVYDYYRFRNLVGNTNVSVDSLQPYVQAIIKDVVSALGEQSYQDFCGEIRYGIYEYDSDDDDPLFEVGFTRNPHNVDMGTKFDNCTQKDVLTGRFDVLLVEPCRKKPYSMFGLVQVGLKFWKPNGSYVPKAQDAVYKDINKRFKKTFAKMQDCFNYKSNIKSD